MNNNIKIKTIYRSGKSDIVRENIKIDIDILSDAKRFKLIADNQERIRVYKAIIPNTSTFIFFGLIKRSRNENIFDYLYLTTRLLNE